MRISEYGLELEDSRAVLVKERAYNYNGCEKFLDFLEIGRFLNSEYRANKKAEEHVWLIGFNTKSKIVGVFELSHGVVDGSFLDSKAVFQRLLLLGCPRFVLAHNHPSGDVSPSPEDIASCKKIKQGADLLGLGFLDFIIIGSDFFSFCQQSLGGL
jgi:DNA repair protein RadC